MSPMLGLWATESKENLLDPDPDAAHDTERDAVTFARRVITPPES